MNRFPCSIFPLDLFAQRGTAASPVIVDVRSGVSFAAADRLVAGAIRT
jgi:hypothetical protein